MTFRNDRRSSTALLLQLVEARPLVALLSVISAKHRLNSDMALIRYRQLVGPPAYMFAIHHSPSSSGIHLRRVELECILAHTPVEVGVVRGRVLGLPLHLWRGCKHIFSTLLHWCCRIQAIVEAVHVLAHRKVGWRVVPLDVLVDDGCVML